MASYITKKSSWLRWLVSSLSASLFALLLCFLFEGPRLGVHYDFLLRQRSVVPISRELLIIDVQEGRELGEDILEPGAASTLLYILTELGARTLIIQIPVLGHAAGGTTGEAEILYRFDEEFSILSQNIRNLFDAIRTGSIAPQNSARYVGELVELSEQGKERLVSALVLRDMEGVMNLERAAAFFGDVKQPGDIRVQLIRTADRDWQNNTNLRPGVLVGEDWYSRAQPDTDSVLRRVAPVISVPSLSDDETSERVLEHIIYSTLKDRYTHNITLDLNGAILFEVPQKGEDFRRIGISDILAYDEADRNLRRLLSEIDALGLFSEINGENRPDFLYDFAFSIREEYSSTVEPHGRQLWLNARDRYFHSLEDFLLGPTEMNMIRTWEEIVAYENESNGSGLDELIEMRNSMISAFASLRSASRELMEIRETLSEALLDSFCILGRGSAGSYFTDVEVSALLANSILTDRAIVPGLPYLLAILSILSIFLICYFIKSMKALPSLLLGTGCSLLCGAAFSFSFVLSGIWLDPLIPSASCLTGVFIAFLWGLAARIRYSKRFRTAYGPFISRQCLKSVIRTGRPPATEPRTTWAAVVAVRNSDPQFPENMPLARTRNVLNFHENAGKIFKKAGGTIIGLQEDMLVACFGSPLERIFLQDRGKTSPYNEGNYAKAIPAMKAVETVSEMARLPESKHWYFGLDIGDCIFAWSAASGYFALGDSVQKARYLARLTERYRQKAMSSEAINEAHPGLTARKLSFFRNKDGSQGDYFYSLSVVD